MSALERNFRFDPDFEAESRIRMHVLSAIERGEPEVTLRVADMKLYFETVAKLAASPSDRAMVLEEAARVAERHYCAKPGTYEMMPCTGIAAAIRQLSSPDEGVGA